MSNEMDSKKTQNSEEESSSDSNQERDDNGESSSVESSLSEVISDELGLDQSTLLKMKASRKIEHLNQLYHQGEYESALVGYQALVDQFNDQKLLANIGYTLQALGRHQEAIQAFEKYLQTFMARHHAWKALCFSYYHLKDYEQMTRCAREAIRWDIRLNQLDDYSWQQMATAHFLMQDYSTALKAARKASTLNSNNAYAYYYEACVISALVQGAELDQADLLEHEASFEQALSLLKTCLKLKPQLETELREEGFLDEVFKRFDLEEDEADKGSVELITESEATAESES